MYLNKIQIITKSVRKKNVVVRLSMELINKLGSLKVKTDRSISKLIVICLAYYITLDTVSIQLSLYSENKENNKSKDGSIGVKTRVTSFAVPIPLLKALGNYSKTNNKSMTKITREALYYWFSIIEAFEPIIDVDKWVTSTGVKALREILDDNN